MVQVGDSMVETIDISTYTHLIGDSITNQSNWEFRSRYHPSSSVDCKNGRAISMLPSRVKYALDNGNPNTLVLGLASNDDPAFTRQQYVDTFDSIPDSILVVMITPFRTKEAFPEQQDRMAEIAQWQKDLYNNRSNARISSWRWTMLNEAGAVAKYISDDGVHPTPEGRIKWAALLDRAIDDCHGAFV